MSLPSRRLKFQREVRSSSRARTHWPGLLIDPLRVTVKCAKRGLSRHRRPACSAQLSEVESRQDLNICNRSIRFDWLAGGIGGRRSDSGVA